MEKEVKLLKNGTLLYGEKPIKSFNGFLYCLNKTITVEDGITLEALMKLVEPYSKQVSCLVSCDMKAFLKESHDKPSKKSLRDVTSLELHWIASTTKFRGEEEFEFYVAFHGNGSTTGDSYAVEYCKWSELKALPLVLNNQVKLIKMDLDKKGSDLKVLVDSKREFTLHDLVYGVFWELGFSGDPKSRDEFTKELSRRIKETKNGR